MPRDHHWGWRYSQSLKFRRLCLHPNRHLKKLSINVSHLLHNKKFQWKMCFQLHEDALNSIPMSSSRLAGKFGFPIQLHRIYQAEYKSWQTLRIQQPLGKDNLLFPGWDDLSPSEKRSHLEYCGVCNLLLQTWRESSSRRTVETHESASYVDPGKFLGQKNGRQVH